MRSRTVGLLAMALAVGAPGSSRADHTDPLRVLANTPATALDVCLSNLNRSLAILANNASDMDVKLVAYYADASSLIIIYGSARPQPTTEGARDVANVVARVIKEMGGPKQPRSSMEALCSPTASDELSMSLRDHIVIDMNVIAQPNEGKQLVTCGGKLSDERVSCSVTPL